MSLHVVGNRNDGLFGLKENKVSIKINAPKMFFSSFFWVSDVFIFLCICQTVCLLREVKVHCWISVDMITRCYFLQRNPLFFFTLLFIFWSSKVLSRKDSTYIVLLGFTKISKIRKMFSFTILIASVKNNGFFIPTFINNNVIITVV